MMRPSIKSICTLVAFAAAGTCTVWWLGVNPYEGTNTVFVRNPNVSAHKSEARGKSLVYQEGMTIQQAARQSNYEPISAATHLVSVNRWSVWSTQRVIDRLVWMVDAALDWAKLDSAEHAWKSRVAYSVITPEPYENIPVSQDVWSMELRPGDQIIFQRK